jgi:NADPH:quinone reductase-like Zn-dependent oxidoreductase
MFAVYAEKFSTDDPLSGLVVGDRPDPDVPDGWTTVTVRAAALNHHDLWSLRGVGLREEQLPMILGSNLVPLPPSLSYAEAACLPTAWLTAYRMLFVQGGLKPGQSVLVQGAGGGVATALITLARAGGLQVFATSRDEAKRARALDIGAHATYATGERLPDRVDAVMETVGAATWNHSLRSLRPGGTLVISGATSGPNPDSTELNRIFFLQLRVVGSTMGTSTELGRLVSFLDATGTKPLIDRTLAMTDAREGFAAMNDGDVFGKIVFTR